MSFVFCIVFALCICLRFGFAASLAVDGLCCVTRSGRRGDWLSPSLLPFLPMDIKLCIEYENTPSLSELGSTTEPLEKCRNDNNWLLWGKWKKEDCWKLQTTGLEQIAESLKPSHTNQASPAQSNPILACPHPTQSKPIQSEPRLSLQPTWIFSPQWSCACTQFRSRSSEIW